jgi:hypothetical protein
MQYYTFALDVESQNLCVISTPFGLYKYLRLPIGVKQSSDISQETMEQILSDLDDVEIYIDYVGCFSMNFPDHIHLLDTILHRLQKNGFTIDPSKCEWAVQETDWLGYWLTPNGLKPWSKKVQALINMSSPTNLKQVRSFLGAVTYYRDMFP